MQAPKIEDYIIGTMKESDSLEKRLYRAMNASESDIKGVLSDINSLYLLLDNNQLQKLIKICSCESSYNQDAVCYAGWESGMGLCGFIPSTWNSTLERIDKEGLLKLPARCKIPITKFDPKPPVFDYECNWLLASWLLKTDGDSHWDSSKSCWSP